MDRKSLNTKKHILSYTVQCVKTRDIISKGNMLKNLNMSFLQCPHQRNLSYQEKLACSRETLSGRDTSDY